MDTMAEVMNDRTTSLDELLQSTDSSEKPFAVLTGHNMGNNTLCLCVPMHQLWEISEVANERNIAENAALGKQPVAQRKLDPKHAQKLAMYIMKGLFHSVFARFMATNQPPPQALIDMISALGKQPYLALQPLTTNIRECQFGGRDLRVKISDDGKVTVYLAQKHVLWVVDGQHRREAMRLIFEFLRTVLQTFKYPKGSLFPGADRGQDATPEELKIWAMVYEAARSRCKVLVEVHLGLDPDQERQLFHDLNNLTKRVEASLAFKFDSSNPINLFIKEQLVEEGLLSARVEEKDVVNWQDDDGVISRKDLISINAILFLNKTNIAGAQPFDEEKKQYAIRFWEQVSGIPGFGEPGAKKNTVAAQPVVLKALAKLAYLFKYGRNSDEAAYEKFMDALANVDYAHSNNMWRYYLLPAEERDLLCPGLKEYLPNDEGGANRDIGAYDPKEGVMRFGPKHNDIAPILGDMIRWSLGLPSRQSEANLRIAKELMEKLESEQARLSN